MSRMNEDTARRSTPTGRLWAPPRPWSTRPGRGACRAARTKQPDATRPSDQAACASTAPKRKVAAARLRHWPLAIAQSALPARSRTLAQSHCHFNFFLRGAVVHPVRPWPIKSPKHLFSDFPPFCVTFHTLFWDYFSFSCCITFPRIQ